MTVLLLITATIYGLASLLYLAHLFGRGEQVVQLARITLALALLSHLVLIGSLCLHQQNPLRDLRGALSFIAFLLAGGFLTATARLRMTVVGAFVAPLSLVLLVVSGLTPQGSPAGGMSGTTRVLGELHIALSALGAAAFGLAAAVALIYLFQEHALKSKQMGLLFRRAPPLNALDTIGRRLTFIGFPLFTLAVATGLLWMARLPARGGIRPEYLISGGTWVIFAALVFLRIRAGLRGRRAALMTVTGFLAVVLILAIYAMRRALGG